MIEPKKKENENLKHLKNQMKDMSQDLDDMKNAREDSKKKLEQRFEDSFQYNLQSLFLKL